MKALNRSIEQKWLINFYDKEEKKKRNYLCAKGYRYSGCAPVYYRMSSPCIAMASFMDFECIAMETTFLVHWSASRVCINAVITAQFKF